MQHPGNLQLLHNRYINKQLWDHCVHRSPCSLVYATSVYLDHMCPHWYGLVGDNYQWVMPVTQREKFGIKYLYQPAFVQQLGVFAAHANTVIQWQQIKTTLKQHYRFWEINVNFATPANVFNAACLVTAATNFVLPLHFPYQQIYKGFHNDHRRNIQRSKTFNLVYQPADYHESIDQYIKHYGSRLKHVSADDYSRFRQMTVTMNATHNVVCRAVTDASNNLMAIVLLLKDAKRLYNMMNTNTAAGRRCEANHFLLSSVIEEFSGSDLLLDFEGSDLPGVHDFYKKFGTINQPYYSVKYNRLPWPINLLKR